MLRYQVDDMSCGHCVSTITQAIKTADPSAEVQANLALRQLDVISNLTGDVVARAIEQAGYTPAAATIAPTVKKGGCCGR